MRFPSSEKATDRSASVCPRNDSPAGLLVCLPETNCLVTWSFEPEIMCLLSGEDAMPPYPSNTVWSKSFSPSQMEKYGFFTHYLRTVLQIVEPSPGVFRCHSSKDLTANVIFQLEILVWDLNYPWEACFESPNKMSMAECRRRYWWLTSGLGILGAMGSTSASFGTFTYTACRPSPKPSHILGMGKMWGIKHAPAIELSGANPAK